jgi:hypothetical protein
MSQRERTSEISKHMLGTTNMSTCCEILELLLNVELDSEQLQNFEEGILKIYNENKRRDQGESFKNVSCDHIGSQIKLLKKLEFIEKNKLSPLGRKVASKCINGEWDSSVTFAFFKNMYSHNTVFRDLVKKIRSGPSDFEKIVNDIVKLHGLNKYAEGGLRSWSKSLSIYYTSGTVVKFDPGIEGNALDFLRIKDLENVLNTQEMDAVKESNFLSDLDLFFSKGTLSSETTQKILKKMIEDNYLEISLGKFNLNTVHIKKPVTFDNCTLGQYLSK